MMLAAPMLPAIEDNPEPAVRWFSGRGCVVFRNERAEVFVGGTMIGTFGLKDSGARNAILVGLVADPKAHLGRIAKAFRLTSEGLRLIRRQYEAEGLAAVVARSRGGGESKVSVTLRRKLEKLFDDGLSIAAAHAKVGRRAGISPATVQRGRAARASARA